jgi:hypothetical protein
MRMLLRGMLPRRTVRMRLTALYGALFVVSGAVLLCWPSPAAWSCRRPGIR